jgi:hypothetical protein
MQFYSSTVSYLQYPRRFVFLGLVNKRRKIFNVFFYKADAYGGLGIEWARVDNMCTHQTGPLLAKQIQYTHNTPLGALYTPS